MLEDIFLLENNNLDLLLMNSLNNLLDDKINVKYESSNGKEEKLFSINDLKNYYGFIKVKYENKEINFLISKNMIYSEKDILQKINRKVIFREEFQKILNINEFPFQNYILEKQNDNLYNLKNGKNISNSFINEIGSEINLIDNSNIINNNYINNNNLNINNINISIDNNISNDNNISSINNIINNFNYNINNHKINDGTRNILFKKILSLNNYIKSEENKIEMKFKNKNEEMHEKMKLLESLCNIVNYKKIENIYYKNILKYQNKKIPELFMNKIFKREVYIYCQRKNIYLLMTKEGKVKQSETKNKCKWNVQIKFSDKSIIFCSKNFYLKENNGNIEGSKDIQKWNFEIISDKSDYYFICPITKNYILVENQEIKTNKNKYEKFKLIDTFDINNNIFFSESNLSQNIIDLSDSIYLSFDSSLYKSD